MSYQKQILFWLRSNKLLIFLLAIALSIRLVFIAEVPPGLHWDEIQDLINAQSISQTGQPLPGMATGILGNPSGDFQKSVFSEIGSYLPIPWILIFGLSWPSIKILFCLVGIAIIYPTYLITKRLLGIKISLIVVALLAVNPWSVQFSRTAYESLWSFLFYQVAIYYLLTQRGWRIFYGLPFSLLAFFSYFGAKPILIPLVLTVSLANRKLFPRQSFKPFITLNILSLIILAVYTLILIHSPAGLRINETANSETITQTVNIARTASIDSPLNYFYENKYTEDIRLRLGNFLGGLSPNYLFLQGQIGDMDQLEIPNQGPFYLVDAVLLLLGISYLSKKYPVTLLVLLGIIFSALTPNLFDITGITYSLRAGLMFPTITIINGAGLYYLWQLIKKYRYRHLLSAIAVLVYLFFIGNFTYLYFARMPIKNSEAWSLPQRVLSRYLQLMHQYYPEQQVTVITTDPKDITYQYLFYAHLYQTSAEINTDNQLFAQGIYQFANVKIISGCDDLQNRPNTVTVINTSSGCALKSNTVIASIKDAGGKFMLINDPLCQNISKKQYTLVKNLSDLDIENYDLQSFCQKWITNPTTSWPQ
ncbi:hypothetical protein M1563_03265 [Patescibacteria group bacterium]|nr:hypothetical protein [Patescibacteria group bacterium]